MCLRHVIVASEDRHPNLLYSFTFEFHVVVPLVGYVAEEGDILSEDFGGASLDSPSSSTSTASCSKLLQIPFQING